MLGSSIRVFRAAEHGVCDRSPAFSGATRTWRDPVAAGGSGEEPPYRRRCAGIAGGSIIDADKAADGLAPATAARHHAHVTDPTVPATREPRTRATAATTPKPKPRRKAKP